MQSVACFARTQQLLRVVEHGVANSAVRFWIFINRFGFGSVLD